MFERVAIVPKDCEVIDAIHYNESAKDDRRRSSPITAEVDRHVDCGANSSPATPSPSQVDEEFTSVRD